MIAQNRSSGSTVALEAMPMCSPCRAGRKRGSIPEGGGEHKFDLEPLWSSTGQQAAQRGRKADGLDQRSGSHEREHRRWRR